jgi:hypothetical protein
MVAPSREAADIDLQRNRPDTEHGPVYSSTSGEADQGDRVERRWLPFRSC